MIKIIIHGCNGRMGQAIASVAAMESDIQIVAGIDKFPDVRENSFPVYKSLEECNESADIIIDFSVPAALPDLLDQAVQRNIPIIIATTGFLAPDLD
jgi:4-hydroxy-tetrahydrodipicolinate reductase